MSVPPNANVPSPPNANMPSGVPPSNPDPLTQGNAGNQPPAPPMPPASQLPAGELTDEQISRLMAEIEADEQSKRAKLMADMGVLVESKLKEQSEAKQKEIDALKIQIDTTKKEADTKIQGIIDEYRTRLANIDGVMGQGQAYHAPAQSPFRQGNQVRVGSEEWYKDPKVSNQEKIDMMLRRR